jgi:sugar/nucleoside kinase (ribokinase family)
VSGSGGRLVGLGSIVVDLVLAVPALPDRGGDVLATSSATAVGGGLNALVAASRAGLPSAYGGGHGTGPFGDLVRAALAAHGVPALLAATAQEDTGFCVVLVDPDGERTFATTVGAEGRLTAEQLGALDVRSGDHVYLSGYDLAYPHAAVVAATVAALPAGGALLLDPGPLVAEVDPALLDTVLGRTDWVTLNAREAALWTGRAEPGDAVVTLLRDHDALAGAVVRTGADGCVVATRGAAPLHVPGVPVVRVVDTNGAGDVHAGTFLAGLAEGLDPVLAAARANAAAAVAVASHGPGLGRCRADG